MTYIENVGFIKCSLDLLSVHVIMSRVTFNPQCTTWNPETWRQYGSTYELGIGGKSPVLWNP